MRDMLVDFQYDSEQDNYIYSFRMSAEKKTGAYSKTAALWFHTGRSHPQISGGCDGTGRSMLLTQLYTEICGITRR